MATQPPMMADEFLVWAEDNPGRYELPDGIVYAMAPDCRRPRAMSM